jgi:DNA-binding beta-propeller fold protein YncE
VAEYLNDRVQVLTPRLDFHASVGVGKLDGPVGVCANDHVIMVSEWRAHRISAFSRGDGTLLHRFCCEGSSDGQLNRPQGVCFVAGNRHVAVADGGNHRVSVFSVDGEFVRHVGAGMLRRPQGVACSAIDELVVADTEKSRVVVFSASGELVKTVGPWHGRISGVAIRDGAIFAQDADNNACVVYS